MAVCQMQITGTMTKLTAKDDYVKSNQSSFGCQTTSVKAPTCGVRFFKMRAVEAELLSPAQDPEKSNGNT